MAALGRFAVGLAILLPAGGCAFKDSRLAEHAQTRLIGANELDLETCLGVPDQHASAGPTDIMTWYATSASSASWQLPIIEGPSYSNGGYCHMTIRFDGGIATHVNYTGEKNATLAPDAYCAPMVRTCMALLESLGHEKGAAVGR